MKIIKVSAKITSNFSGLSIGRNLTGRLPVSLVGTAILKQSIGIYFFHMCYYVNDSRYSLRNESSSVNLGKTKFEANKLYDYWKDVIEVDIDNLHFDANDESESDFDENCL